jgi:EGF-like domain
MSSKGLDKQSVCLCSDIFKQLLTETWSCKAPSVLRLLQGESCESEERGGLQPPCVNDCSGHGVCVWGFCKCKPGRFGIDCSRSKAGYPVHITLN